MALAGGLSGQFGLATETTFATAVTPSRFLEYNSETLKQTIARLNSMGMRPKRRVLRSNQWLQGRISVSGDVEMEFQTNGFGLLLHNMLGEKFSFSQPNAGSFPTVYQGVYRVGQTDGNSFTCQKAVGDTSGTIRAFTYAGCKINKWDLSCEENGFLKLKIGIDGASETTSTALASASYTSGSIPLSYLGGTIKFGAVEAANVKSISLSGSNSLALDRYFIRSAREKKEQLEDKLRAYTGSFKAEFNSLELYEKYTKGEEATLEAKFVGPLIAGTYYAGLTLNLGAIRFDGETPVVPGPGLIDINLPFTALEPGSEGKAVEAVYTTTDTAE